MGQLQHGPDCFRRPGGAVSDHTPAPWPAPDTQMYAWAGGQESVLKGGVLSMADYLHARQCVNEAAGLRGAIEAALSTGVLEHGGVADILREAVSRPLAK